MNIKNAASILRTHARTLALGGLLAVSVASIPLAPVFAQPKGGGAANGGAFNCTEGDFTSFNGHIYVCHRGEWVLWSNQDL
jgi:hypothetical protein